MSGDQLRRSGFVEDAVRYVRIAVAERRKEVCYVSGRFARIPVLDYRYV
jgi:predicted butyrate kinase (DUF1464 family)